MVRSRKLFPLALALTLAAPSAATQDTFVYTLGITGRVSINGTLLEKLKGAYKPDSLNDVNGQHRWLDMEVEGNDRTMLRVDGYIQRNGVGFANLPFSLVPTDTGVIPFWYDLDVLGDAIYAVRTDGLVYADGDTSVDLPTVAAPFTFGFSSVAAVPDGDDTDVYVMRVDGSIWRLGEDGPGFYLAGDVPPEGETEPSSHADGQFLSTAWMKLAHNPVDGMLYAVRRDGVVMLLDPADYAPVVPPPGDDEPADPPNGTLLVRLPINQPGLLDGKLTETYSALRFDDQGRWVVLRYDGRVYRATVASTPEDPEAESLPLVVDFAGTGSGAPYVDMSLLGEQIWVLRSHGRVFNLDDPAAPLFTVPGQPYGFLAATDAPPDGSNFKNRKPYLTVYKTFVTEGQAVDIPVRAVDLDLASEHLTIEVDLQYLEEAVPGASYDDEARVIHWPDDAPVGKYVAVVSVDDGKLKKPRRFKLPIRVLPADDNELKNIKPIPSPIRPVIALVDKELSLPLITTDMDGDELSVTPWDTKGLDLFDLGATYDPETGVLSWTPTQDDIGRRGAVLLVEEVGPEKPRRRALRIKVLVFSQLVFAPAEGDG